MSNISINNISEELKNDFINISNDSTNAKTLELLVYHYKLLGFSFSEEERETINKAISVSPKSSSNRIKKSILNTANAIIKSIETDTYELNLKNSAIAADKRALNVLDFIFKHNEEAKRWYDRIFITANSFMKFAQELKNSGTIKTTFNKYTIDRCIERSQKNIDEHHNKFKLDSKHNVKAHHHRIKLQNEHDKKQSKE